MKLETIAYVQAKRGVLTCEIFPTWRPNGSGTRLARSITCAYRLRMEVCAHSIRVVTDSITRRKRNVSYKNLIRTISTC